MIHVYGLDLQPWFTCFVSSSLLSFFLVLFLFYFTTTHVYGILEEVRLFLILLFLIFIKLIILLYNILNIYIYKYCRVTVFGPSSLQRICREWGQKLDFDETTTCFGDERHIESGGPTSQGEGTPRSRTGICKSLSITQEPPTCLWASPSLGGLCCYLFLSFVHPPPTLVSHPCLSLSACPLSHSF